MANEALSTGQIIRVYRKMRNLSQNDLSKATGLSIDCIKSTEQLRRRPNLHSLRKIMAVLDIPPAVLGFGDANNTNDTSNTLLASPTALSIADFETFLAGAWTLFYVNKSASADSLVDVCLKALANQRGGPYLTVRGKFHQLAGILARDRKDQKTAMLQGVMAVDIARQIGQVDNLAAALFRLARTCQLFHHRDRALALMGEAYGLAPRCRAPLRGWLALARVEIEAKIGEASVLDMRRLLERAATDLANRPGHDGSFTVLNRPAIQQAESLALLYRGEALPTCLSLIARAQRDLPRNALRWQAALRATQSLAYAVIGDVQAAVDVARDVVQVSRAHSHMNDLKTAHRTLATDPKVRNHPAFGALGTLIQGC